MKTNNLLLKIVSSVTNIAWYLNMVVIGLGFISMIFYFIKHKSYRVNIPCSYKTSYVYQDLYVQHGSLNFDLPMTPLVITIICLALLLLEGFLVTVLYNLRTLFSAIKHRQPFDIAAVKSLRTIGILLAMVTFIGIIDDALNHHLAIKYMPNFDTKFVIVSQRDFYWLYIGAIIYIIADIFKYGIDLKKETEEFV